MGTLLALFIILALVINVAGAIWGLISARKWLIVGGIWGAFGALVALAYLKPEWT